MSAELGDAQADSVSPGTTDFQFQSGEHSETDRRTLTQYRFLVLHVLSEQFHAILVRYDVWHLLQQNQRVFLPFLQVGEEMGRSNFVDQPMIRWGKRTATVASIQA